MNIEKVSAYKCGICGTTYLMKEFAEKCCQPKYCEDCGSELPYKWYYTTCNACHEKREYDKATKMTIEEYNEKCPDNMVYYGDEFYFSVEDCLESLFCNCEDAQEVQDLVENLEYIYGTYAIPIQLDGDSIIQSMEEDSNLEDFDVESDGYKELNVFLEGWNKKYGTTAYTQDEIVILIPKDVREKYAK